MSSRLRRGARRSGRGCADFAVVVGKVEVKIASNAKKDRRERGEVDISAELGV